MRIIFKLFLILLILTCLTSHKGWTQSSGSLVINELLITPNNLATVPPLEFIELDTNLSKSVDLRSISLHVNSNQVDLQSYNIASNQYVILCPRKSVNQFTQYDNAVALPRWLALHSSFAITKLTQVGNILDQNKYIESWYNSFSEINDAWSLVCINLDWNIELNWPVRNSNERPIAQKINASKSCWHTWKDNLGRKNRYRTALC